ncbi:carbon-nitrogen hydrolase [Hyaloscypha hepaticicola]|uniref:nitrilase n=1 Tax=Hyaloscypha hepaticicola TaxID=2082293 RepID=A0A2J6PEX1_9HELO|nr:carbon-nitrogen hydrolase [Hyaloscypha hepaticicola]
MTSAKEPSMHIRVAVTQAEPEWLDLEATVSKTCELIQKASKNGAQLITFPECWIPGYPAWIWSRSVDFDLGTLYQKNSLAIDSSEMQRICASASQNKIVVALGFAENYHHSLYISQALIGADGEVKIRRRKIKATHMERTIFGDASGDCLRNVAEVPEVGKVGMLACWEHVQPLLKFHTFQQKEEIHVAAWPPVFHHMDGPGLWSMTREGCRNLSATYAIESQTFVLHTTAVITQKGIDKMGTAAGAIMNRPGGGSSAIFGPDGRQLSEDLAETEEGIIYANLDFDAILRAKSFLDCTGHYSRPDMLWLGVDDREKLHRRVE